MRQRTAAIVAGAVAAAALVVVLGIAALPRGGPVCSLVGYSEYVEVHLVGHPESVADAQLCDVEGCSPRTRPSAETSEAPGSTEVPAPDADITAVQRDASTWDFQVNTGALPTRVDITAYDSAGRALALRSAHLVWRRAAPESGCDVHRVTKPVTLSIPAARS